MKEPRSLTLRELLRYMKPYRRFFIAGATGIFLTNLIRLISPIILGRAVDGLRTEVTRERLLEYGGVLVLIASVQGLIVFAQRRAIIKSSFRIAHDLRNEFFDHLQKLPADFYQSNRTGDLMALMTNDIAAIRLIFGPSLITMLNTVFITTLILPMMFVMSWRLTLLGLAPLPLSAIAAYVFSGKVRERFKDVQQYFGTISNAVQESLAGVRVIKAYAQEHAELEDFKRVNHAYVDRNLALIRLASIYNPILQFFIGLSSIVILWQGGRLIINNGMTLGQFVQFTIYLGAIIMPVVSLGGVVSAWQRAGVSAKRLRRVLAVEPAVNLKAETGALPAIGGEIEFRGLTFSYEGANEPALQDVNLRIERGEKIAIVGPVGSGKTTLLNLLPRILDARPDRVLIDGRSITELPLESLRSAIGYVPQETFLFSDTIANNIAFGCENASKEEIGRAAEEAGIAAEIEGFPLGYETIVGERGITLSGGQKQRIAIARTLIRKPRVLILDDALSAVDAYTEERILKHLSLAARERTSLIASNRISTVRDADLIVVMNKGRIVERGAHDDLVLRGGLYSSLYEKQMLEQELSLN